MKYLRQIHKTKLNGFTRQIENKKVDVYLAVYGIFDTEKVHWEYYYVSVYDLQNGMSKMTNDCSPKMFPTDSYVGVENLKSYGNSCKKPEDGLKWCEEFKIKWESGSNDLISEVRDKKLNEILK